VHRSALEFADGYLTTTPFLELRWKVYLAGQEGQPYTAPAVVRDLQGLPPAARRYPGQIHGFASIPALIPQANEALAELATLVRQELGSR